MVEYRLICHILSEFLMYVNLALSLFSCFFYVKGARKSEQPWRNLKVGFAINTALTSAIYIYLIFGGSVEPWFVRLASTAVLLSLAVGAYLGAQRHGRTRPGGSNSNNS